MDWFIPIVWLIGALFGFAWGWKPMGRLPTPLTLVLSPLVVAPPTWVALVILLDSHLIPTLVFDAGGPLEQVIVTSPALLLVQVIPALFGTAVGLTLRKSLERSRLD
jgi:hypothetical protein